MLGVTRDIVIEYEYKLDEDCANKATVKRREYSILYFFVETTHHCKGLVWEDEDVNFREVAVNETKVPSHVFVNSYFLEEDQKRFGPEPDQLAIAVTLFEKGHSNQVRDIAWDVSRLGRNLWSTCWQ